VNIGPQKENELGAAYVPRKNKEMRAKFRHPKCNVQLCVKTCFRVYHTKLYF
jgi:hypothetical protein